MKIPDELIRILNSESRFLIISHINPEGDALGSSIALALALRSKGKDVRVVNIDGVSSIYRFLPYSDIVEKKIDPSYLSEAVLCILDCNDLKRVGIKDEIKYKRSVVIDHHETESGFGDIKWIEPESPATGLMIYHLLKAMETEIDADMATCLYTAISIDTGTFRYSNTSSDTLRVAADLIDHGASPGYVAERLYESWSENRFKLLVEMLKTMEIIRLKKKDSGDEAKGSARLSIALTVISMEMFRRTGTTSADTENFSNFPRMIESIDISAMFRETSNGQWKASLRSKGELNVARIASALGGGGHKNAAGFTMEGDVEDIKRLFVKTVQEQYC